MRGLTARIERLPLRLRVTLAFVLAMALLLGLVGLLLYLRLGSTLRENIDDGLRTRLEDVAALARDAPEDRDRGLLEREALAQLLRPDGRIVAASSGARGGPLLTPARLAEARTRTVRVDRPRPTPADPDGADRLLAAPRSVGGRPGIVVVGASLDPVEEAQHELGALLLVVGPIALLLASLAGYGAASAALRPIDRIRRRADAIHVDDLAPRLPEPAADDEVARLARTLNAMLDRIEEGFRRERTFVDDASHELRSPLALIKAELELALRPGAGDDERRAALVSVAEENERLVRLAEDLLVLARSAAGGRGPEKRPLTVAELVGAARADPGLVVAIDDEAREAELLGDAPALARALSNLLDNAHAAGAGRVRIGVRDVGGDRELHVVDDGPGFPPGFAARAFDRFSRADAARGRGGTGLGLAIVRAIARAHGGEAFAGDGPDGGADVGLRLPRR
ncbi:ATP-binding protein [Patulibacter defluvii]|uniref:ATP-binding protein n=1 Tax=Patulibacter defluvii TaxID=3095358 RepID=UPI002A75A6E9|nr:ATP-binding protein [Patulibacter sp. DM4]